MGLVEMIAQYEAERTNRSFEEILAEFFDQEHSDAVICAKDNYDGWINLINWDLLMIRDAYKKLTETNDTQEYQKCFNLLKEDIDILNNQNESINLKICKVSESNWHLVKLAGYIDETLGFFDKQHQHDFTVLIDKMKNYVHNFITNTNAKNIKDFIWAEETWSKLPQKGKYQILYDLEDIVEEEGPDKEWLKA